MRISVIYAKLSLAIAGCALALAQAGCLSPWPTPPATQHASQTLPTTEAPAGVAASSTQAAPGDGEIDMASVLDKLQQVRNIDPAAEQKLLDELRQTPAKAWPLVAEQYRASLAYREQLKSLDHGESRDEKPLAEPRYALRERNAAGSHVAMQSDSREDATLVKAASVNGDSTPIGSLVDPHEAVADDAQVLAKSSPYALPSPVASDKLTLSGSEPAAPGKFSTDGPSYPIAARDVATGDSLTKAAASDPPRRVDPDINPAKLDEMVVASPNGDWQQLVNEAADNLSGRVAESPTTTAEVHKHVSLRILRLLAGDTEKALEPIPHVSPAEQDYWSRQLFALAVYLDHHSQVDDKRRAAASVTHLDEAVSHLRELGSLSIRNLAFCKNVYGYGAIEPYDQDRFSPGQQVFLYVEVENYHSQSTEKGFCTSLGSTYELLDEHGTRVGGGEFPDVDDCCRSRRRDFHIQFGVTLPEKLAPGQYQLQLVVKDRQSDKIGHASVAFEIGGGGK